jgi:GNAT superfamily N-acetyltransferase
LNRAAKGANIGYRRRTIRVSVWPYFPGVARVFLFYSDGPRLKLALTSGSLWGALPALHPGRESILEASLSLIIRPAVPGDAALVFSLVRELAEYERLLHEVEATEELISQALFSDAPRIFADIAEWEGVSAGLALWFYNFSTFKGRHGIYLEDLFVRPGMRGHGIGKALLRGLARRCAAEGLARLEWSVLDWNEPSVGFYRSLGAVAKDEWTVYRLSEEPLARLGRS